MLNIQYAPSEQEKNRYPFGKYTPNEVVDTLRRNCKTVTVETQDTFYNVIPTPLPESTITNPLKKPTTPKILYPFR